MGFLSGWLQRKRTSLLRDYISGDVLEVGCGPGATLEKYSDRIKSYTGIEVDKKYIELLKKKYPEQTFVRRDLDIERIGLDKKFDTVVSLAVIEHIFNQKFSFGELVESLKPKGKIVITTPTPIGNDIVHALGSQVGLFDRSHHDDHIVIYNKKRFKVLAEEFGMKIVRYKKFQLGCNQIVVMMKR